MPYFQALKLQANAEKRSVVGEPIGANGAEYRRKALGTDFVVSLVRSGPLMKAVDPGRDRRIASGPHSRTSFAYRRRGQVFV
jgi:hypothetical protein